MLTDRQLLGLIRQKNKTEKEELKLDLAVRLRNLDIDMSNFAYECGYISGLEHLLRRYEKTPNI